MFSNQPAEKLQKERQLKEYEYYYYQYMRKQQKKSMLSPPRLTIKIRMGKSISKKCRWAFLHRTKTACAYCTCDKKTSR